MDNNSTEKFTAGRQKMIIKWDRLACILCFFFLMHVAAMQLLYMTVGKAFQMVYMAGWMEYAVNGICLLLLWGGLFSLLYNRKSEPKIRRGILLFSICLAGLFLGNIVLCIRCTGPVRDIISISPNLHTAMVLKQDRATGKVATYRPGIFWFVRESEAFPYTADKKMKIQWLEKDVCAVTYTSPEDGNIHQCVMTYGARDKGDVNPPMYSRLDGVWGPEDQNTDGWYLRTDEDGGHLKKDRRNLIYKYEDCEQLGSLVMMLYENGTPQWTVVLKKDCIIDKDTNLVTKGTISLGQVSMEKTIPQTLSAPAFVFEDIPTMWERWDENGAELKKQMQKIIQEDPKLDLFEPGSINTPLTDGTGYKIVTDSTDIFQIGLLANQADPMQRQFTGYSEVQITSMELLAGDVNDFCLEISYIYPESERLSDNNTDEASDKGDQEASKDYKNLRTYEYRIMKGDGVYLAAVADHLTDGTIGLEYPDTKQRIETANDPQYRYFVEKDP